MDSIANCLTELQTEFIRNKEYLKRSKETSQEQIQNWRIDINGLLDELENKTIQALEQRVQSQADKIQTALRDLQASTNDIQSAQNSLKSAGGNMAQMFVSIKMANKVASVVREKVNTTRSQFSSTEISFEPHLKLQSLLNEMKALGDISLTENLQFTSSTPDPFTKITSTQASHKPSKSQSASAFLLPVIESATRQQSHKSKPTGQDFLQQITRTQTKYKSSKTQKTTAFLIPATTTQTSQQSCEGQPKPTLLQAKCEKRYTVKLESDYQTCSIYSVCTLADGSIILADRDNAKLKRVDSTYFTVTDHCDIPYYPFQVCAISDQEVAVCCGSCCLIQFVSIEKTGLKRFFSKERTMHKTRQLNTGFPCYALAYADGKLFVSDMYTSVFVYSMSGERLQQFSKDHYGRQIFSDIRSLAVTSDHSKIYVADRQKSLIILDRTGRLVGQFNGPELQGACSVCLSTNDSVLVCGRFSNNVLQFSLDGELLGEILKTDRYETVCCNKDNTKLIVSRFEEDEIEVYDIS